MSMDDAFGIGEKPSAGNQKGIFALRGDLDGTGEAEEYSELSQFIGLMIGDEEFLLPIASVSEIIMLPIITFVPGSPENISGVINLRGTIIPAVNMRKLLGLETITPTQSNRIIVVQFEEIQIGLIVDSITYVIPLAQSEIQGAGMSSSSSRGAELIGNIGNRGDKVNGIFDLAKIVFAVNGGELKTEDEEEED